MLYLDYAKKKDNGFILNFFADSTSDIEEISNGKPFITKNGTNYGVPLASSTIVITVPDRDKLTYVLNEEGEWKEYKEETVSPAVTNYNLSAFNLTESGILSTLRSYMATSSGTFSQDEFVKRVKSTFGGATKRNKGYYTTNVNELEPFTIDGLIFGKLKSDYTTASYPKSNLDMDKKYLIELRPRLVENFSTDLRGEVRNDIFYTWVCKAVKFSTLPFFALINEDCELTGEELEKLFIASPDNMLAEDPKNPDIFIILEQNSAESLEDQRGATFMMAATKQECEYFALNVVEM